jgi:hypothetical protein
VRESLQSYNTYVGLQKVKIQLIQMCDVQLRQH